MITIQKINGWIIVSDDLGNVMRYLYYSKREALRKFKDEFGYRYKRVKIYDRDAEKFAKRGRWLPLDDCMTICSECNSLGCNTKYCPNCGAEMEMLEEDENVF